MSSVTFACPDCELAIALDMPVQRAAEEFCPRCDFPMFWAPEVERYVAPVDAGTGEPVATAGTAPPAVAVTSRISCGRCATANPERALYCLGCGRPLRPGPDLITGWLVPVAMGLAVVAVIAALVLFLLLR